jgi:hypothetical protein
LSIENSNERETTNALSAHYDLIAAQIREYQATLQHDPDSRKFFTLAKLYKKVDATEDAEQILVKGIAKHPDFLDARLLLA